MKKEKFSFAGTAIQEVARVHGTTEEEVVKSIAEVLSIPECNSEKTVKNLIDLGNL